MNAYELLMMNRNALEMMSSVSMEVGDIRYIPIYQEYIRLTSEGHKITYIMQYLSDEYQLTDRQIYRIVNRFSKQIKL